PSLFWYTIVAQPSQLFHDFTTSIPYLSPFTYVKPDDLTLTWILCSQNAMTGKIDGNSEKQCKKHCHAKSVEYNNNDTRNPTDSRLNFSYYVLICHDLDLLDQLVDQRPRFGQFIIAILLLRLN